MTLKKPLKNVVKNIWSQRKKKSNTFFNVKVLSVRNASARCYSCVPDLNLEKVPSLVLNTQLIAIKQKWGCVVLCKIQVKLNFSSSTFFFFFLKFSFPWTIYLLWDPDSSPAGTATPPPQQGVRWVATLHPVWHWVVRRLLAYCPWNHFTGSLERRQRIWGQDAKKKTKKSPDSVAHFTSLEGWRLN